MAAVFFVLCLTALVTTVGNTSAPTTAGFVSAAEAVPGRVTRVIDADLLEGGGVARLGAPGENRVFVTAAGDVQGLDSSEAVAQRLTLLKNSGESRTGPFALLEFDTPQGIGSPVFRKNPGFIGFGRTAGGASEYDVPNLLLDELQNLTTRVVP
jgi:hypothetical protein